MLSSNTLCVLYCMLQDRAAQDATGHHKVARHGEARLQGTPQLQTVLSMSVPSKLQSPMSIIGVAAYSGCNALRFCMLYEPL
jgi:hypothetical protein